MNNNGDISFDSELSAFTPQSFPLSGTPLIAPYWADVDTSGTGNVSYRETQDLSLIRRARGDVLRAFSVRFQPTFLFVATWDRVGYFSSQTDKVSSHLEPVTHIQHPSNFSDSNFPVCTDDGWDSLLCNVSLC